MDNGTTEKMLLPTSFYSGKVCWSDTSRTTPSVVGCGQDSQDTKHIPRWVLSPLPFQLDLINSSSTVRSAFSPQQGTDMTSCPKELGLCRIYHCFPLIAFPYCESCKCLCKVLRFLHCYGNTVLCSYWNIHPTSIQHQDSQMPAKYLSK